MVANITINPIITTNAYQSFNITSDGYIQGEALDQPAIRFSLAGGTLAQTETLPMWGGVAIQELIGGAAGGPNQSLGGLIGRATSEADITGFSVFDQDHSMIQSPESPVPLAASGMMVNFYRLGSGARIAVACSPNLVNLEGELITTNVAWDYVNQQLEPYVSQTVTGGTYPTATTINSGGTYTPLSGAVSLTTNAAHGLQPGDTFTLSSMAGTGSFAALNGTWVATTGTTSSTLNFTAPTGLTLTITGGDLGNVGVSLTTTSAHGLLPGDTFVAALSGTGASLLNGDWTAAAGTSGSTLTFIAASGIAVTSITGGTVSNGTALPVKVLDVQVGNSMVVEYNSTSGFATWNRQGNCAVILI